MVFLSGHLPIVLVTGLSCSLWESDLQVCASAEHPTRACQYDGSDTVVDVEQAENLDELILHRLCEGIVFVRSVEGDDDDLCRGWGVGRDMGEGDVLCWECGVGRREVKRLRRHGVLLCWFRGLYFFFWGTEYGVCSIHIDDENKERNQAQS